MLLGGAIVSDILVSTAEFSDAYGLLDPLGTAGQMATRILGEALPEGQSASGLSEIDTAVLALGAAAWFAAGASIVGFKYPEA